MKEVIATVPTDSNMIVAANRADFCRVLNNHFAMMRVSKAELAPPNMQMISFGPTIRGAHSPDERCQISSVQKYWGFLMETLKRIPAV